MGTVSFYDYVSLVSKSGGEEEKEGVTRYLDLEETNLGEVLGSVEGREVSVQMEYMRILESRYLQSQPKIISEMAMLIIMSEKMHPLVRLETIRWWRDGSGQAVQFRNVLLPLLTRCWEKDKEIIGLAYLLNFIAFIVDALEVPMDERSIMLPLLEKMMVCPTASEDFRYRAMLDSRRYLDKTGFTDLVKRLWDRHTVFGVTTWLLLVQYLVAHPTHYDPSIFSTDTILTFLGDHLTHPDTAPWDRADAALILLNMNSSSVSDTLRARAQNILHDEYEFGADHPRPFYQNSENVHCIALDSAQEILDFLHQEYPTNPHHQMSYYDDWIMGCLVMWPQDENDTSKIWTAMCRISKDYSVHGRHRDRLVNIMRLVVCFIDKNKEHSSELRRRFLEELIDMSGTCSTGFAVRLLNVLSGYNDFSIRIPPEHALRCRFFLHLNKAMMEINDEEYRAQVMDELTLPASHYSDRVHFLEFFAKQLPLIKETLYSDFKDTMTDTDFDFYLRKCIYHYEGGLGDL